MPAELPMNRLIAGGAAAVALLIAHAAAAAPIEYDLVPGESNVSMAGTVTGSTNLTPDLLDQFPLALNGGGVSATTPSNASTVTADVGIGSGTFDNGGHGIDFSELVIDFPNIGNLFTLGYVTVPLELLGAPIQLFAASATMGSFNITLDDPFSSTLTPTGNANEWLWAGLANVTISGEITPTIIVPDDDVPNIEGTPTPFSQQATIALAGTFSGDQNGTRVTVGLPDNGQFEAFTLDLPGFSETFDPLDTGLFSLSVNLDTFALADLTGEIVYADTTPIPEPGTALLLGLGLVGLAARRRR